MEARNIQKEKMTGESGWGGEKEVERKNEKVKEEKKMTSMWTTSMCLD